MIQQELRIQTTTLLLRIRLISKKNSFQITTTLQPKWFFHAQIPATSPDGSDTLYSGQRDHAIKKMPRAGASTNNFV
jgi:hypothetical protein